MKKILFCLLFTICMKNVICQDFFISAYVNHHIPFSNQIAPYYFTAVDDRFSSLKKIETHNFSLSRGIRYGISFDYSHNRLVGFGLNLDYGQSETTSELITYPLFGEGEKEYLDWLFKSFNLKPKLVFQESINKLRIVFQIGPVVSYSNMDIKSRFLNYYIDYHFNMRPGFGYSLGLKTSYTLNTLISISLETGIDNIFYNPKKAKITDTSLPNFEVRSIKQKEIEFFKELDKIPSYSYQSNSFGGTMSSYETNRNEPAKHITEALKLNSYYFGLSISLNL